jgi:hypothetical protein
MVPVRPLAPNVFVDKMEEVSKWHCGKKTDITVNGSRKILNSITYAN